MGDKAVKKLYWAGKIKGSAEKCCKAVREVFKQRGQDLYLLPYDFHRPYDTTWWLSPIGDKPAYHAGKYFFHFREEESELHAGFLVEKGIDQSLATFCTSLREKNLVMEEDWQWHKVMDDLPGDEPGRAEGRLVVKKDPRTGKHVISFPVVCHLPECCSLGNGIRTARHERC